MIPLHFDTMATVVASNKDSTVTSCTFFRIEGVFDGTILDPSLLWNQANKLSSNAEQLIY